MREDQWLTSHQPRRMLTAIRKRGNISQRKLALFVVACDRNLISHLWPAHAEARRLEIEERIAETAATDGWAGSHDPVEYVRDRAFDGRHTVQNVPVNLDSDQADRHRATQVSLLRCIFGNPYRPKKVDASWVYWNGGAIPKAAHAAYQERELPSGRLDNRRLAVLADMLEEAGCRDEEVLGHLRGPQAVHVRGCFVIDLLLGKE